MAYRDNYSKYLKEVPSYIDRCRVTGRRVVFGYTSDLDIVFRYDPDTFQELFGQHLKELPKIRPKDSIDSIPDLARVTAAYMAAGEGGEIDITDYSVCEYLNSHLEGVHGLGGTCAQGAAALAAMGMPLIAAVRYAS